MGTRGLCGFVVDGEVRSSYNHFDSYPSGLGAELVEQIGFLTKESTVDELKEKVRNIFFVDDEDEEVTPEYIEKYKKYYDASVGDTSGPLTWYQLLRNTQGDLIANIDSGIMINNNAFANDSLFCEWGYLVNLDTKMFEVYRGFQKKVHMDGRFADADYEPDDQYGGPYYPIALVAEFPFDDLPDINGWDEWEAALSEIEEAEEAAE